MNRGVTISFPMRQHILILKCYSFDLVNSMDIVDLTAAASRPRVSNFCFVCLVWHYPIEAIYKKEENVPSHNSQLFYYVQRSAMLLSPSPRTGRTG